ncbi:MAG: lasso peptide biosynthesis B2 protein [Vitreimonas sp.]
MQLAPHIHACEDNGEVVLLDLRRNRYWGLPAGAFGSDGFQVAGLPRGRDVINHQWCDRLLARGDLVDGDDRLAPEERPRPLAKAVLPTASPLSVGEKIEFVTACLWADRQVRRGSLDIAFARLAALKERASGGDVSVRAAQFLRQRPWFPHERVCLFDSLALFHYAARAGQSCELVVAVRSRPFAAHCWVERGGHTLNDFYDTHASFTPIFRI